MNNKDILIKKNINDTIECNIRLNNFILRNIEQYNEFFGHVAFVLSLNLKNIL